MENYFARLNAINVNEHVEKKGQFSYLSWPFAVAQLRLVDPEAHWEVRRFDGLPYLATETGVFVEVAVTVKGVTLSQIHPVLDGRNQPIPSPTAFDINTSLQRALVKAIALHGLGLYIYAGEDLPAGDEGNMQANGTDKTTKTPLQSASVTPLRKGNTELLTPKQLGFLRKLVAETGTDEQALLDFFGFEALDRIPKVEVNRVIKMLEQNRRAAA